MWKPKPFLVLDQHIWLLWAGSEVDELHPRDEVGKALNDESLENQTSSLGQGLLIMRCGFCCASVSRGRGRRFRFYYLLITTIPRHQGRKKTVAARNPAGGGEHQHV